MEFSGAGFKLHSDELSIATSKNLSFRAEYHMYHSFRYTHVITSRKFQLKQKWRLMKAIAKVRLDTEQTIKLEKLYEVGSDWKLNSWLHSTVA